MKTKRVSKFLIAVAFAACASLLHAQEKSVGEKSAEVWEQTKETTKEVTNTVAKKAKETVAAVEDAIDKPDTDAKTVDVKITDQGVQMPARIAAGKTAFVVTNNGKQKHNFEVEGENLEKSFWLAIAPGASKTMQVNLKPGTYEADCKLHQPKEAKVKLTVK